MLVADRKALWELLTGGKRESERERDLLGTISITGKPVADRHIIC